MRTAGIVGTGKIGAVVAAILNGFGCRLLAYDIAQNPDCVRLGVRYVPLDELWAQSDIITLHAPLTAETRHMIDASIFDSTVSPSVPASNMGQYRMAENLSDFDLRPTSDGLQPSLPPERRRTSALWILFLLLLVAAGGAVYYFYYRPHAVPDAETSAAKPAAAGRDARAALGSDPMKVDLPPIDESDEIVRRLVSALSSHPTVSAWLATKGLVRNFTVVVSNIAEEDPPLVHVMRLRPAGRFEVIERNGEMTIDPRTYQRYTPLATAVASIDPEGAARLYATVKPLIEQAHRDLGYGNTSFDATLERAIVKLLSTPVLRDPVRVEPKGIGYGFEDPRIEALTPAQKHLLRFGPGNGQMVRHSLRSIAAALGIPRERLPN